MGQAEMAAPAAKASWTVRSAVALGEDLARAIRLARSGRPGPVHLSLPADLLEGDAESDVPAKEAFEPGVFAPAEADTAKLVGALQAARSPLLIGGPMLATTRGRALLARFEEESGVPAVAMESPRGINDPCLGLLAEVLRKADVVLLAGKPRDFTLKFGAAFGASSRVLEEEPALEAWIDAARRLAWPRSAWRDEVRAALAFRPSAWKSLASGAQGPVHPVEVGRQVQKLLDTPDAVLVADGGEFGQWAQATTSAPHRVINGPAGSIGAALPFAAAAKLAFPRSHVVAMLGDGTFGFHSSEIDTALRCGSGYVAVVGNDACWNAEHQIQLRTYGKARAHGCELLPTRYDLAAAALGAHGEFVTRPGELDAALSRAVASGKPALVNVMIERLPAPVMKS
jgi:acetolactate synthase-1/2/3 large subunit